MGSIKSILVTAAVVVVLVAVIFRVDTVRKMVTGS